MNPNFIAAQKGEFVTIPHYTEKGCKVQLYVSNGDGSYNPATREERKLFWASIMGRKARRVNKMCSEHVAYESKKSAVKAKKAAYAAKHAAKQARKEAEEKRREERAIMRQLRAEEREQKAAKKKAELDKRIDDLMKAVDMKPEMKEMGCKAFISLITEQSAELAKVKADIRKTNELIFNMKVDAFMLEEELKEVYAEFNMTYTRSHAVQDILKQADKLDSLVLAGYLRQESIMKDKLFVMRAVLKAILAKAEGTNKALIEAQIAAAKAQKELKERKAPHGSRQVKLCEKAKTEHFKNLYVELMNALPTQTAKLYKETLQIWMETSKVYYANLEGDASDDELREARLKSKKAFIALYNALKMHRDLGYKFQANAKDAKVNTCSQSELYDVIGVVYGKTTDMVVTVGHYAANMVPMFGKIAIADDPVKAEKNIDELEIMLVNILTQNGMDMTMLPGKSGKCRIVHYDFWNANNSALKVGKCMALSHEAFLRAKKVAQMGMTDEEYNQIPTSGSHLLKWWSYAQTPGCVLKYKGKPLTIRDVLVVKSRKLRRLFANVKVIDEKGNELTYAQYLIERTGFDGEALFLKPIPSQQLRGGFAFKGFGVCVAYDDVWTMIDEIAEREGLAIPEFIEDIDGVMRRWRDYTVICTEDCWKWAGLTTYSDYCDRMDKLAAEGYEGANLLYTARIADATEEGKRKLTRQSIQQFLFGTYTQMQRLLNRSERRLLKLTTPAGVVASFSGLNKPENVRTPFEHLIEVAPEMLEHPLMQRIVEDRFNRGVAEAAVRPDVNGIYPYITEDPVALIKMLFFGGKEDQLNLGYLKADEVNIPNAEEGKRMYAVRYPNNFLCGMILRNHNDDIYRCCGNVAILSVDGPALIRADGDVDGDEMCFIFDKVVIEMMERTISEINPPLIVFPHGKVAKKVVSEFKDRARMLAESIVIANKFGPAVGQNSNLATKFMNWASNAVIRAQVATRCGNKKEAGKQLWIAKKQLDSAIVAHIAAIIAIDLAKTGEMPAWLQAKLDAVCQYAPKKMPWNQRFCKDTKATPWFAESWNKDTQRQSNSFVDRAAWLLVVKTKALHFKSPISGQFNVVDILPSKEGLYVNGSKGKLENNWLAALEARNYRNKVAANSEGDDQFAMLQKLASPDPTKVVGLSEMARFLWRNQASLVYVLQRNGGDKLDNAAMTVAYYEFCHDLLIRFGSYCGNAKYAALSPETQAKSNVWKLVDLAFADDNGIGNKAASEDERQSKKASFLKFILSVFAYDLYLMVCDKKHIVNRWVKPAKDDVDEAAVMAAEEYEYSDADLEAMYNEVEASDYEGGGWWGFDVA